MIQELFTYLQNTPKLKEAKTFGHLTESISLLSREKRCKKNWQSHRLQCQQFILESIKKAKNYESVLILGSGPLHEIPIDQLAREFKQVVLVDIVHLRSTKKKVSHLGNIEFIEHDVSEVEHHLRTKGELLDIIPSSFINNDWGLVLSVNIMSQLPIHIENFIQKKLQNKFNQEDIENYLKKITENHFKYLSSFTSPVILITDITTLYYNSKHETIQTDHNYAHLCLPPASDEWTWHIAPIPEFKKDIGIKMIVAAFIFNLAK